MKAYVPKFLQKQNIILWLMLHFLQIDLPPLHLLNCFYSLSRFFSSKIGNNLNEGFDV